ncbi:MAG: GNAT family N-acetyltransferase [Lachnospiraceae bacterium]|nr:GNAT family N-acetyltransferase [Lachnospiraceae bacterium]
MDYIILNHSIKKKDENGRILAEITFPENTPGVFTIDRTYVCDDLRGENVQEELVKMAIAKIREQGGKVEATCPYASGWIKRFYRG